LSVADSLFDITSNPMGFFSYRLWKFSPLLVFLAVVHWQLITAPPTLTVVSIGVADRSENVYKYEPRNLVIAYVICGGMAFLGNIIGARPMFRTRRSYSNAFSTVIRTSRNPDLDKIIRGSDTDGANPLPESL
ncbi:hypothetical protein P152DRAFT_370107, partial [Eremomyces bilateralis CBS 781.70]